MTHSPGDLFPLATSPLLIPFRTCQIQSEHGPDGGRDDEKSLSEH